MKLKSSLSIVAFLFALSASALDKKTEAPVDPHAGGTLKGAALGGAVGYAVGHPKTGAVIGAVIGHHKRHKAKMELKRQQKKAAEANG
jgi:outer membrane lipoprotein SlyB